MFPEESDKIERYVGGLPDMIHKSVIASKSKTMQDAIEMATELIDKKIRTFAERVLQMLILVTIRGVLGQVRNLLAMNVEPKDISKGKNNNCSNQGRNGNAPAKVYTVGRAGSNPNLNVVMGTFLLNNRYASVLFDTSVDRSFVSTAFSS
ncbi:hypothetical protein Tco_1430889 [Tanacetum coccineum]